MNKQAVDIQQYVKQSIHLYYSVPTNPFTILEPQDQEIGEFYVVQKLLATDLEAPKF